MGSKLSKPTRGVKGRSFLQARNKKAEVAPPVVAKEVPVADAEAPLPEIPTEDAATPEDTVSPAVEEQPVQKEAETEKAVVDDKRRKYHNVKESTYWFPNDSEEMDRLTGQHYAVKNLFGGNIHPIILEKLELATKPAKILDIGCGPGTWLKDVSKEYPLCDFTGVDMTDVFPKEVPSNVKFELGNALKGLDHPDNSFDFVAIRLLIIGLKKEEWAGVMKEAYRLVKPGGYLQWIECGMLEEGTELTKKAGKAFENMITMRGQEADIAEKLQGLFEAQKFTVVDKTRLYIRPGLSDPVSTEFRWDIRNIFKTAEVLLRGPLGYTEETYPEFLDALFEELQKEPETHWSFTRYVGQK